MRIEYSLDGVGHTQADKIAAMKIKQLIGKLVVPILKTQKTPDTLEEYKAEFGYMGPYLHATVLQQRTADQKQQGTTFAVKSAPGSVSIQRGPPTASQLVRGASASPIPTKFVVLSNSPSPS